jgi:hypothetical protein
MNKLAYISGYMNKNSAIKKKVVGWTPKMGKGILEGLALGGLVGPTAAAIAGDDIKLPLIMGLAGGAGAGAIRPFTAPLYMSSDPKKKALAYALMIGSGIGTAVISRKIGHKIEDMELKKKLKEAYDARRERLHGKTSLGMS